MAYCGADLFVVLSYEETEGIVVLEALASQVPVLIRDIPFYQDWLIHKRNVYKVKNLSDFARITREILNYECPNLVNREVKTAKARSLEAVAHKLREIYLSQDIKEKGIEMHYKGRASKHPLQM